MQNDRLVKVKYFYDRKHYAIIEVKESEVEKIREINRMTWREEKAEERKRKALERENIKVYSLENAIEAGIDCENPAPNAEEKEIAMESMQEEYQKLHNAIQQLKSQHRQIVEMVYFKGLSQDETAKKLGIKKSALSLALSRIYGYLKKFSEEN